MLRYKNVCIESLGYTLPREVWTSDDVEKRLSPLYERLKLPQGRLELMTGIKERRFWEKETRPSEFSINSCRLALDAVDFDAEQIGCLIHGSVCRDFLEPATACVTHHELGLRSDCVIYDVSNACLGILSGMLQAANMIELGQTKAALVVGSESGRSLVESTINELNTNETYTRKSVKPAFASLTIGSASCAVLLTHRDVSNSGTLLCGGAVTANTRYHDLCQSHTDAGSEMQPLMDTDSEELMRRGIETGQTNFEQMLAAIDWKPGSIDKTVCHQVGAAHRKLMLDSLSLSYENDFMTFETLGNTGSAALPISLAKAAENNFLKRDENVALLGIGSGINCVMLGVQWQATPVMGSIMGSAHSMIPAPHLANETSPAS